MNASAVEPACSGDFSADRPGLSTDTAVLARGCQQLEAGYQYSRDDTGLTTATAPLLLYRAGINDALELRASWDGENFMHHPGGVDRSANDPSIGAKLRLHDSDTFSLSLLGQLSLPAGSAAATSGEFDPTLALLWKRALSTRTALSGAFTRTSISTPDAAGSWQSAIAVDLGRDFGDGVGAFVEYADSQQRGEHDAQTIDIGATWLITRDMQLDVNGGRTWQRNSQHFVGFGAAWRY